MNRKKLIVLIAAVTVVTAPSTVTVWADNTTTSETANGYIESELDNNTPLYEPDESIVAQLSRQKSEIFIMN